MIEVLVQKDPYRYIKMPDLLENGQPDYRIQKWNNHNGYKDMYLCDNFMQLKTAIEDFEYTKWLDPAGVPCYVHDVYSCPNHWYHRTGWFVPCRTSLREGI